ncbi:hypothetical protein CR513_46549, partial [Mucuna pruriens]
MELPQQQSPKVQYEFSGNPNSENLTTMAGFADSSCVANSMLAATDSTKMVKIDDCVPTVFDLADVVKIANYMTNVTNLTDMTSDKISDQVTRVEIANPACADADITNPMCVDAKIADPRYANVDNAFADKAEDVDSLVDKSDNVNMTEMADSVVSMLDHANILEVTNSMMEVPSLTDIIEVANSRVNISAFVDMLEMSNSVADVSNFANVVDNSNSADITKVLDSGTEVPYSVNNFLAHEPTLADSGQNLVWAESNSGKETNTKFDMSIRPRIEGNLDDENQKQPEAESISSNHSELEPTKGQNRLRTPLVESGQAVANQVIKQQPHSVQVAETDIKKSLNVSSVANV